MNRKEDLPINPTPTRKWRRHEWITVSVHAELYAAIRTIPFRASRGYVGFGHVNAWHVEPLFVALDHVNKRCSAPKAWKLTLLSHDIIGP
jgi:hypothetical protein